MGDRRLRDADGALAEIPGDNSDSDRQIVRRKFAQETADCDSASRQRCLSRGRPSATRCREVESFVGQRGTGREYAPARAAMFDQFLLDVQIAVDLTK